MTLTDASFQAEAVIEPSLGNNVTHFRLAPRRDGHVLEALVPPAPPEGLGANGYAAGNPILFPFPNRVPQGRFTFEGKTYALDVNEPGRPNHIHGLVCNRPWRTETTGAGETEGAWHRASISLQDHPDAARQFPFPCRLTVTTRLREGALEQETEVVNLGAARMPMGYGIHPWFPATHGGGQRAETEVQLPANERWELKDLVPTGKRISVQEDASKWDFRRWHALDGNEYDDVFTGVIRRADGWIAAAVRYPSAGLELHVEASRAFREWCVFAPNNRPVVVLEPYTCATNAVNLEREPTQRAGSGIDAGLIVLEPGDSWTAEVRISLRAV